MSDLPKPIREITLKDLAQGEIENLFKEQLTLVRENISDKRTWFKGAREITLRVIFLPENEEFARIICKVGTKLQPISLKPNVVDLSDQQYFQEQGFFKLKEVK
jgi:hypothetical protein